MYTYIDDNLPLQKTKYKKLFKNTRLKIQSFQELNNLDGKSVENAIRTSGNRLYNRLESLDKDFIEETIFEALKSVQKVETREEFKDYLVLIGFSIAEFLDSYNRTLLYVYENEAERKCDRYVEGMIALLGSTIQEKIEFSERNVKLWSTMLEETSVDAERDVIIASIKADGFKKVKWLTMEDTKVCKVCRELDGMIFDIENVPPRPHIHCRCEIRGVK